jgi:hypothetical protein
MSTHCPPKFTVVKRRNLRAVERHDGIMIIESSPSGAYARTGRIAKYLKREGVLAKISSTGSVAKW